MDSEKVKDIKKALEQNDDNGIMYEVNDEKRTCKFIHHKDILTYINELENTIKNNLQYAKGYGDGVKATVEVAYPKKLNEFAERLKDMPFNIEFTFKESSYEDIKKLANLMKEYSVKYIDEILKEFIN